MHRTDRMGVVVIEAVREHAVHQRGVFQRKLLRHADDRAAMTVGERAEACKRPIGEVEARRRERSADHVDDVILEKVDELARQLLVAHVRNERCDGSARRKCCARSSASMCAVTPL